ncbi:MAG: hypothetical protein Q4P33_03065 [Flaviflexus sp.]|nr:hypothetical protein [Flaviflexus sp.]
MESELLTDDQIAADISQLRSQRWIPIHRVTLSGAQSAIAYRYVNSRRYRPRPDTPSTHVVKPALPRYAGEVLGENATQRAVAILGFPP